MEKKKHNEKPGKRENPRNAGRKLKYGEPTVIVGRRVPKTKVGDFKEKVAKILNSYLKK